MAITIPRPPSKKSLTGATAIVLYIALVDFVVHMLIANNYGYFRDELYYIVAGQRLSYGYVDFPPLIAVLAAFVRVTVGISLVSIHVIPAIAASAMIVVASLIARELGGGTKAQILTAVATMFSGAFAVASIFSMDVLDMLWWTTLALLLVKIIKRKDAKLWIAFGLVAGIALMTKLTVAFFLVAVLLGLTFTSNRKALKSRWVLVALIIAVAIVSPYLVWNYFHSWDTVNFFFHHGGLNGSGPLSFLGYQVLIAGLLGFPLAIIGLFYFFGSKGRQFASFGVTFLILIAVFTLTNGKPYFMLGAYPLMIAAGAVQIDRLSPRKKAMIWPSYLTAVIIIGIALAPVYAPVVAPQTFVKYYGFFTGVGNGATAQETQGSFPQYLGDRFGWDTMTASVAQAYSLLNTSEKTQACILTSNYGEASALIVLGKSYNLPPVISGHNNYYVWGPGNCNGNVLILVGFNADQIQTDFASVTALGNVTCDYCMSTENGISILLAIQPRGSLQAAWPSLKDFS